MVIGLAGSAIYLFIFGITMSFGAFTWTPDWLGTHGEPFLVITLSLITTTAAINEYRALNKGGRPSQPK